MCGKSFSESGYLKRNLKGTNLERKHFSAPNVTGVFQHQSSKFNRGLAGERNHLGAPNGTTAALSQITKRIFIGPLQATLCDMSYSTSGFLKRTHTNAQCVV